MRLIIFIFLFCGLIINSAAAMAGMEDYPVVKLQSLDKITARTMTFEAKVGSTLKYGPLYIKIQSCRKAPPIEQPESAAFLQIWEVTPDKEANWVFSGWMFASSPALSPMDHPVYDVWVIDCLAQTTEEKERQDAIDAAKKAKEESEEKETPEEEPVEEVVDSEAMMAPPPEQSTDDAATTDDPAEEDAGAAEQPEEPAPPVE